MSAKHVFRGSSDERRSRRIPFGGEFRYLDDLEEGGKATWCSIGENGACIRIGRYLRPGRRLLLLWNSAPLLARIVWCKPTLGDQAFVAGIKIFADADAKLLIPEGFGQLKAVLNTA